MTTVGGVLAQSDSGQNALILDFSNMRQDGQAHADPVRDSRGLRDGAQVGALHAHAGEARGDLGRGGLEAHGARIGHQRAEQPVGQRVPCAVAGVAPEEGRTGQRQVTQRVEHLVTHGLVGMAQAAGAEHGAIVEDDGILEAAAERFARGGIGQAGVKQGADGRFQAWLDDWRLQGQGAAPLPGRLQFELDGMHVELALHSDKPWVLHGDNGYSRKSAQGQASYYYSQPHIRAEGILRRPGGDIRLTGRAWLDREWSSRPLADDQPGWDWFALHLQSGEALMVYRLRHNDGDHWLSGTWIGPDGATTELKAADIRLRALAHSTVDTGSGDQRRLPLTWSLALPGMGREWRIEALYTDQWLGGSFPYWEGPIRATGSGSGIGYMELTGY